VGGQTTPTIPPPAGTFHLDCVVDVSLLHHGANKRRALVKENPKIESLKNLNTTE